MIVDAGRLFVAKATAGRRNHTVLNDRTFLHRPPPISREVQLLKTKLIPDVSTQSLLLGPSVGNLEPIHHTVSVRDFGRARCVAIAYKVSSSKLEVGKEIAYQQSWRWET